MKPLIAFFVLASIASLGPIASAQDDVSKKYIELLEKNAKLMDEIQTLKKENQTLEAKIEELQSGHGEKPGTVEKEKKIVGALGTAWEGKATSAGVSQHLEAKVIARVGKTMTLESKAENGAILQFECQFNGDDTYVIKNTRRIKAANGVVNPAPVGGVTGKGHIRKNTLVHNFVWKRTGEPVTAWTYELDLVVDGNKK